MTSDDSPVPAPAAEPLQFEHADFTAAPAAPVFGCSACAQPIADAYYEIHGQTLCAGCRDRVAAHFTGGSGLSRFVRVMIGGLAAVAGTLIYFVVLAATGYQAALIAILVGYMVGAGVRKGSRHRGGLAYQLLAVFLTYTSIVMAPVPLIVVEAIKKNKAEPAAVAAADPAAAKEKGAGTSPEQAQEPKTEAEAPPAVAKAAAPRPAGDAGAGPGPGKRDGAIAALAKLALLLVIVMGYLYASPFLEGSQSLLGLAIIFFGLLQAWRMNRKVDLAINGPFQVSGGGRPPREMPAHA